VGFPLESKTSLAFTCSMTAIRLF